MDVTIERIDEKSKYLANVIELGRKNSQTLGFFPLGAFEEHARNKNILISINENNELVGYLLYRIVSQGLVWPKIVIVHLCVDKKARRRGVAHALINELAKFSEDKFLRIELACRQDYEINKVWSSLGFSLSHERIGRSGKGNKLDVWVREIRRPPLFALWEKRETKLQVVIDANVLFRLQESPLSLESEKDRLLYEEAKALESDWLEEDIKILITKEVFSEIDRSNNVIKKGKSRNFAQKFPVIESNPEDFQNIKDSLLLKFPDPHTPRSDSDVKQLAYAITGGAHYFVTQDEQFMKRGNQLSKEFGITVVSPGELVSRLDEMIREVEYHPVRLAGSGVKINKVTSDQIHELYDDFRCTYTNETKSEFIGRVRAFIANPDENELFIVSERDGSMLALIGYSRSHPNKLEIPFIRVKTTGLSGTVLRYLIRQAVVLSSKEGRFITIVTDTCISEEIISALIESGFFSYNAVVMKINLLLAKSSKGIANKLEEIGYTFGIEGVTNELASLLSGARKKLSRDILAEIERKLWPVKVLDAGIQNFVIPIAPRYAKDLFDEQLARQNLWGANETLMLSLENVYYRSLRGIKISAPARILWYVTGGEGYQGVKQIRAYSMLDEVKIGTPKELYRRYRRLGVYKWNDVIEITNGDVSKPMMALRFSGTELFTNSIKLDEYKKLFRQYEGKGVFLQSPQEINSLTFEQIYKMGKRL